MLLESPEGPQVGPLTGKPCLWWRYRIEEYRSSGRSRSWRIVERDTSTAWLRFTDGTGECLIDPEGAEVLPARKEVWTGASRRPGGTSPWYRFGKRYRYTEERLHAGEPLYAIGEFRSVGGGRNLFDLQAAKRNIIAQWKGDFDGLLGRFDSDGDGRLDEAEWGRVRLAARLEAEDLRRNEAGLPAQHRMGRPAAAQPFVLSSHGQEVLARRFVWEGAGWAVVCMAGAVLVAVSLGVVVW